MSKTVLNLAGIELDATGRVILSDDDLIALEADAEIVSAGGNWNTWCSGGYNPCGNTLCSGSTNGGCTNTISCSGTTNSGNCR